MDSGAFQTDYIPNFYEMDVIYWITSKKLQHEMENNQELGNQDQRTEGNKKV